MKRLYFLSPNIESTLSIVDDLKDMKILEHHIHVVGNDHHTLEVAHLYEASFLQTTDFVHALVKGAVIGAVLGLIVSMMLINFPPEGLMIGHGATSGTCLFGAGFGAWISSRIGLSTPDPAVSQFKQAVAEGQFLMIVDIHPEEEQKLADIIKRHHPEALVQGIDLPMDMLVKG